MKNIKSTVEKKGELFVFSSLFLWSFFPIVMIFSFLSVEPLFSAAMSSFFAAFFFLIVLLCRLKSTKFRYTLSVWKDALIGAFMIGVIFSGIVFFGASLTTAGNVAILGLMEVFFTFLFLNILFKHEKFFLPHFIGAIFMVIGAGIILCQEMNRSINWGDLIIIGACAIPPLGNYYQKKAIAKMDINFYMFFRSILGFVFLGTVAYFFDFVPTYEAFDESVFYLMLNGFFLLGLSKLLWMQGLKRLSVTKSIALTPLSVVLTLVFAYFLMGEVPGWLKVLGIFPILIGTILILKPAENRLESEV